MANASIKAAFERMWQHAVAKFATKNELSAIDFPVDSVNGKTGAVTLSASDVGAAASSHTHDDRYYTETEVDSKLSGKANTSHGNHVPTTQTADNKVFLRNDNTWATVTPANIGAAANSHTHTVANISDLTATATELNYVDGVTSSIQTQLNGKAASSHTHTVANISDLTATAKELNYMDGVTSNVQTQLDGKLSTSGGTMSGAITTSNGDVVKRNNNTSGTYFYGGTDFDNGAFLGLYGKSQSNYAGQFRLLANNGTNSVYLEGKPDGTLRWNGKDVLRSDSSISFSDRAIIGTLPVANGGTGANTASGALANLGFDIATGSATRDSNNVDSSGFRLCGWGRFGAMVFMQFNLTVNSNASATWTNYQVATGLPKPNSMYYSVNGSTYGVLGSATNHTNGTSCYFSVDDNGSLIISANNASIAGKHFVGSVMYFTNQ